METAQDHLPDLYKKYHEVFFDQRNSDHVSSDERQHNVDLNELILLVENLNDFMSAVSLERHQVILKLTQLMIGFGSVKEFPGEEKDYGPEDYPGIAYDAEKCFHALKQILVNVKSLEKSQQRHFLTHALLLCGAHNKKYHWCSDTSVYRSNEFLTELLTCLEHKDLQSLLCDETFFPTIFQSILKTMRPMFVKDKWTKNPSSCHIFYWLLRNVKHPHLADFLNDVFPPPFLFLSHFSIPYQVLGIQCFDHILNNVPPTLIKLNGREDAIYHALSPLLYSKDPLVVNVFYPCVLKLPSMSSQKFSGSLWIQFDQVFSHLLVTAEMEGNTEMQKKYLSIIASFVNCIPPFKHLKRILSLIEKNMTWSYNTETCCRIYGLKILNSVIKSCWPRMENHCFHILKMLLILQHDLDQHNEELNTEEFEEINELLEECVILLKHSSEEKFQSLVVEYLKEGHSLPGFKLLQTVLAKDE